MALLTFLALSLMLLMAGGCGGNSSADSGATSVETNSKPLTINKGDVVSEEEVEQMIVRKMGQYDYTGGYIVRDVTLTPEAGSTTVTINVGRPSSCHPGQVVGYITEMSRKFMSSLFLYDNVGKVEISLYGTTEDHSDKDKLAARTMMTRADADKIDDWFTMNEFTMGALCTEYWVEPTIYANWQSFGSQAITDPSLLQQANQ